MNNSLFSGGNKLDQLTGQIGTIWKSTSFAQRIVFIVLFFGLIFGFIGLSKWAKEPEYGLLYSDLDQKEASEIVAYLRDNDITYKVKGKGNAILVPTDKIHEIRMSLAKDNLPRGGTGFELFDKIKFGMSNLAQKVNYRRALQGELSKTISQLDGVEWARVQIVITEPSLFVEDEQASKASIIVKTKAGHSLKSPQISGIMHLVSASVEGLVPENVTITDSFGNLLSKSGDSTVSGIVSNQMDYKRKIEDYHAAKALSIIEKITGRGNAIVRVSADIDFMHVDEKQIIYDNDNKVPISQTIQSQSSEFPIAGGGGASSKEKEETEKTQYAISKTERVVSNHVASVKRLTVAVLVDGTYEEEETEDGEMISKYIKRSQTEMDQIAAIVKQAIGIDETPPRNDKFELQNVQFQRVAPVTIDDAIIEKEKKREFILKIAKNSSLVIAVLAFLMFALRTLKRLSGPQQPQMKMKYATYDAPEEIDISNENFDYGGESDIDKKRKEMANKKRVEIRDEIISETKTDSRTTSNLIRKWLKEGD